MFHRYRLHKFAKQEYRQARGTTHKLLLQRIRVDFAKEFRKVNADIASLKDGIVQLEQSYQKKLAEQLAHAIVHERIQEVYGVGEQRKAQIIQQVFRGRLDDLYRAYEKPHIISRQIQQEINRWVHFYKAQFPVMLEGDFTGKREITQAYLHELSQRKQKLTELQVKQNKINEILVSINRELAWLVPITQKTFFKAAKNPNKANADLSRYVRGVFGEWEPMPEWFRGIVSMEQIAKSDRFASIDNFPKALNANVGPTQRPSVWRADVAIVHKEAKKELVKPIQVDVPKEATPKVVAAAIEGDRLTAVMPVGKSKITRKASEKAVVNEDRERVIMVAIGSIALIIVSCCIFMMLLASYEGAETTGTETAVPVILSETATAVLKSTPTSLVEPANTKVVTVSPTATATAIATLSPSPEKLLPTPTSTIAVPLIRITIPRANLREGPIIDSAVVAVLSQDELVELKDQTENGSWYQVELTDGTIGWIGSTVGEIEENRP